MSQPFWRKPSPDSASRAEEARTSISATVLASIIWVKPDKMGVESKSPVGTEIAIQMTGAAPATVPANAALKTARILREESVIVEGAAIPCKVVMEYEGPGDVNGMKVVSGRLVSWIDPKSGVSFRQESTAMMQAPDQSVPVRTSIHSTITMLRAGATYPDSIFKFTPS